jgi:hypothetical protein
MTRVLLLIVGLGMAGCSGSPESYGITGPGASPVTVTPPSSDDSTVGVPGLPDTGTGYGPSIGPMPQSGRYFNYN